MNSPEEHERRLSFAQAALILLALIFLYIASAGPVLMLTNYYIDTEGPQWVTTFYYPVGVMLPKLPAGVASAYGDYLHWWLTLRHPDR